MERSLIDMGGAPIAARESCIVGGKTCRSEAKPARMITGQLTTPFSRLSKLTNVATYYK